MVWRTRGCRCLQLSPGAKYSCGQGAGAHRTMRTTLNWIASILVGVCAAPLAALIVGTAADFWEKWLRVSTQEGAPGYWVVMFSSIAALGALIAGVAIARGWLLSAPHFLSA